ncbi:MAG: TonB family protein [Azoarcus sp.]|nr:TonB family protein [Azoarcus sp.]
MAQPPLVTRAPVAADTREPLAQAAGSRLLAAAFIVSLLLHGALLAISFRMPEAPPARDRGLEVVLVNARHATAPVKPEVLAQANLDGGGTSEQKVRPKSPLPPQNATRDGTALIESRQRQQQERERPQQKVLTQTESPATVSSDRPVTQDTTATQVASGLDLLDSAVAIARLEAEIDRSLSELAQRPRKKTIGSRANEYRFAQYVEDWRLKIERIGELNYPEEARGKLYGSLLLSVTIRGDGSVERIEISRSSGYPVLDAAARRIVELGAPYAPFPPDIRKDTDLIEITRTWKFTKQDQVRAN